MVNIADLFQRLVERSVGSRDDPSVRLRHLVTLWILGCAALVLVTWICFQLAVNAPVVAFAYLIVIVLLSLLDSFVSSAIFSVVGVGLLNYFFVPPIFTFQVNYTSDLMTLVGFVVTSFAVTGLVRRIYWLGETQREQARLLDLTQDAIIVRGMDDIITYWNRGAEAFYGWRREETARRTTHELLRTDFPVPLGDIMATLRRSRRWEGELCHTKRDGTQVFVASRWSLQLDASERPIGIIEINNDITERRLVEDALRRSQAAYLAEAQRLSSTGSFGWRITSGELYWSAETYRIFGYDPSRQPSLDLVMQRMHPDDMPVVRQELDRAERDRDGFELEHRLLMPDGSVKHLHVVARAMDETPELHFVGAVMDVTAARNAQDELALAQAEVARVTRVTVLGQLTASIAHEVSQPLAAIVANGEAAQNWLRRDPPELEEVRDSVRRMVENGRRAGEVVQRIRALSRKSGPEMARLDVNGVVHDSVPLVRREITDQRIVLRLELGEDVPEVLGDRVQLQQVVINLLINAVQAMAGVADRPRELAIQSSRDGDGQVLVSVRDTGVGIEPASADRLFDPFYTTKTDGMGIGLSICCTIIEAHGGRLWALGSPGVGADFRFCLPGADA